jgi:hypothetical protein
MSTTSDPNDPRLGHGVDAEPAGMNEVYLVLADDMLARGFVRPVLYSYIHPLDLGGCGTVTTMGAKIAETYAARPQFYGSTFCAGCNMHLPVGPDGVFEWVGPEHVTWEPAGELRPATTSITAQRLKVGT